MESSREFAISRLGSDMARLVATDALVLDVHPELLEEAAEEEVLRRQPREGAARGGGQIDLLRRRRHVVLDVGSVLLDLDVGDDPAACVTQLLDGGADLLRLPPADLQVADAQDHGGDAGIALDLGEFGEQRDERLDRTTEEVRERGALRLLDVLAGEVEHQGAAGLQLHSPPGAQHDRDENEQQNHDDGYACASQERSSSDPGPEGTQTPRPPSPASSVDREVHARPGGSHPRLFRSDRGWGYNGGGGREPDMPPTRASRSRRPA
jgi:hypothetical protein